MNKQLSKEFIVALSQKKKEPKWMLNFRLQAFNKFQELTDPDFGPEINLDFTKINFYQPAANEITDDWQQVACQTKQTFQDLGVIKAEQEYLAGVTNQQDSEVFYHKQVNNDIIFTSTDEALKKYPKLFKKYFNQLVKYDENKYTALNSALWSGGSFIFIPANTKLDRPLQSYFRIESAAVGQFERTIIIVDEGAELSYIEGCTAPTYSQIALHAGVVEIYVGKKAKCKYSTIQNWSKDVYNLVTKRAIVEDYGLMEWIDGNLGSRVTMKYPSCILKGYQATGNSISIAVAKVAQVLDAGAKMIHLGQETKSNILSKSIAQNGGQSNYRGTVKITKEAINSKAIIKCDTIILDDISQSDTFPTNILANDSSILEHEATVSKISAEKLFYLTSKGINEEFAKELLIMGFINDFKKELPLEYAVELNRLLKK
ncbi:MAG TPA: Fe-S cluster assembly protein SufB [Bacilli bacterium]|nr:Fe-S cluster assembly protein SufB [Bacilli bacterium]